MTYTRPPGWRPERTRGQAADATADLLRTAGRWQRRWPARWPDEPGPADNTPAGDLAAWHGHLRGIVCHDWARSRDPDRYGRTYR